MAFPESLDVLQDPQPLSPLEGHAALHTAENAAIRALESKVGIDSSDDPASLDYRVGRLEARSRWVAGQDLGGHRVVAMAGDASAIYADCAVASHAGRLLGLTTGAASAGAPCIVAGATEVVEEPSWSWTADAPVYLGHDGLLTQTVPAAPDALFSLVVGVALTPTKVLVSLREPLFLSQEA